jgi:periplasmic protein TonB
MMIYWKPLQLSLIFHGILLLALINLNMSPIRHQNVLVIDFSMKNAPLLREGENTVTVSPPLTLNKNKENRYPISTVRNRQNEEKPIIPPELSDKKDILQKEPQKPVMAVNENNLDTTMGLTEFLHYGTQGLIRESGFQKVVTSVPSFGSSGNDASYENKRYLKAHFSYIKELIHNQIIYPATAKKMGWEGKVIVSFIVSSGGYARDVRISKSSGYEILDENAIKAINNASPFPKPPVEAQIIIPILYRLN